MDKRKTLKEIALEKGKKLFIESISFSVSSDQIEVLDSGSTKLIESSNGESFKAVAIVRNIPVTKFTENLNGRVYPKILWERVFKSKIAEGTLCLADHPSDDSDGSVKDIVGVWRNFKVNESNCTGDLYLVGTHGKHFLEVLQAGGKNGLSSVGFGELREDEKTVDSDTFELVRLSDWVLNPSQQVFATTENIDESTLKEKVEIKENHTNLIEKRNYNMSSKVEALTIRNNVKVALRESQRALETKGVSLVEAKSDLIDTLGYIPEEFKEERDKLQKQIDLVESTIKQTIEEKSTQLKESVESASNLKVKYEAANDLLNKMKEDKDKAKKVINLILQNEKAMKSDIDALVEDKKASESDITALKENFENMSNDLNHLIQERKTLLSDIRESLKDKINMIKDIKALKSENSKLKAEMKSKSLKKEEMGAVEYPEIEDIEDSNYEDEEYSNTIDPMLSYQADDEDMGVPFANYDDEDGFLENKKSKMRESVKKIDPFVLEFYREQVKKQPALKKIKEHVIRQSSIVKAVKIVEKFLDQRDSPIRLKESFTNRNDDWVGDRNI